ncbi:uncharacterized protein LOC122771978 [Tachysurus ichikawai]
MRTMELVLLHHMRSQVHRALNHVQFAYKEKVEWRTTLSTCYNDPSLIYDTAIVGCIRSGQEEKNRKLIQDFVVWCDLNLLNLNTTNSKEMVVDSGGLGLNWSL